MLGMYLSPVLIFRGGLPRSEMILELSSISPKGGEGAKILKYMYKNYFIYNI